MSLKDIYNKITGNFPDLQYRPVIYMPEGMDKDDLDKIKKKISAGKGSFGIILISENENDLFDIVTPFQLKLPVWKDKKPVVCGIARNKDEAGELVGVIVRDCMTSRGNLEVKKFLCSQ